MLAKPHKSRLHGMFLPMALLLGSGALGALRGATLGAQVSWQPTFRSASALAARSSKPMLLLFHAPDCGWCDKLEAETLSDSGVLSLTRKFVCVRIDSEVDAPLCYRFAVDEFPTTVVTDSRGRSLLRIAGFVPPAQYVQLLRSALDGKRRPVLNDVTAPQLPPLLVP